jgi:hypothetical protein
MTTSLIDGAGPQEDIDDLANARGGRRRMTRIAVYRYRDDGGRAAQGWFTLESAQAIDEADPLTPARYAKAVRSGHPFRGVVQTLYRTDGGRWVLKTAWPHLDQGGHWVEHHADLDGPEGGPRYEFVTDADALDWLNRYGHAERVEQFFGDLAEEQGPGRPEIGGRVQVRLGDLLPRVDAYAAGRGCSRAEAVRILVAAGLAAQPPR